MNLIAQAPADPGLNDKLRLLWGAVGRDDYPLKETREFNALLQAKGSDTNFPVTAGTYGRGVWRGYLRDFSPLLFR